MASEVKRFNVGDRVRCIDPPGTGQLVRDETYEVMETLLDGIQLVSLNVWPLMLWNAERFEPAGRSALGRRAW